MPSHRKLLQLLELVGMEPLHGSENAIVHMNSWAQKNLLRQGERWEEQTTRFETLKPAILPLLRELGFVDPSYPQLKYYQGAIVHGALLPTVRTRLYYLTKLWREGIRFSCLYFLSGERPLEAKYEGDIAPAKTECEMMEQVWAQSKLSKIIPKEMPTTFINAPMKKIAQRSIRPTTNDTVEYWLKEGPPPGHYLAISNAPYTPRQDLVIKTLTPKEYAFETVGPGASVQEKAIIYLDELARYIYSFNLI